MLLSDEYKQLQIVLFHYCIITELSNHVLKYAELKMHFHVCCICSDIIHYFI